jgi:hypothetical protein
VPRAHDQDLVPDLEGLFLLEVGLVEDVRDLLEETLDAVIAPRDDRVDEASRPIHLDVRCAELLQLRKVSFLESPEGPAGELDVLAHCASIADGPSEAAPRMGAWPPMT